MQRHLGEYATGVDLEEDSGLPHLAHIAANCLILLDAEHAGTLIGDRHIAGFADVMAQVAKAEAGWPEMPRRHPRSCVIASCITGCVIRPAGSIPTS